MSFVQAVKTGAAIASAVATGVSALSSSKSPTQSVGLKRDNFLELLISQITHQNPLQPMDNETMVTQLTQMQTLEKIEALDEKVGAMMTYQNVMNSMNYIGKEVMVLDKSTNTYVSGKVDGIKIEYGFPGIVMGGKYYDISQIVGVK